MKPTDYNDLETHSLLSSGVKLLALTDALLISG